MLPSISNRVVTRLAALSAIGLLAHFSAGCSQEEERQVVAQPVRLFLIEDGQKAPFRNFPGEVVSPRMSRLSFEVSGRLIEFPIQNGQMVKKGDLIGQLDTADFIAARDSAQASFDAAKSNFDRNAGLQRSGAVPMATVDRARQELDMADATLRTALRALEETRIVAPFDGRIADRIAREMQNIRAQEKVAILEDISSLEIEINIPERDMMMIGRQGLTVEEARDIIEAKVGFSSMPGNTIDLYLKTFNTRANRASRTFLVSFAFDPPPDQNILPGMTGAVLIRRRPSAVDTMDGKPVRMVPVEAITTQAGASTVWRLDPKSMSVSAVPVEISSIKGGFAMVLSEQLANGNEIVSSGARFLAEGTPVSRFEPLNP